MAKRAHLIVGGFPAGSAAGHDMDYVRLRLLGFLAEHEDATTTVANDFAELDKWLVGADLLMTYVAGPIPNAEQHGALRDWLHNGGRWFALHGTSGGRAARIEGSRQRKMVKEAHHETLGSFFLNHPPVRRFDVAVSGAHPLTAGLPGSFETVDELYLIETIGDSQVLLTTELPEDPSPPGFGFKYDADTSLQADGKTRVLGYVKEVGAGRVAYVALGHCHSPRSNSQPFVDASVADDGVTPKTLRGSWETDAFQTLVQNAVNWGLTG
jgi:type 1 glutamine amidotransferase